MTFTLNIECSKEFDELHIKFSDGTGVVTTKGGENKTLTPKNKPQPKKESRPKSIRENTAKDDFLDIDDDFGHSVSQEVVKPPDISLEDRPVKVAEELQNFDF